MKENLRNLIIERNPEAILFDELDECIIGMDSYDRIVYSYDRILKHFIDGGMDEDIAIDWIDYNIFNLRLGELTPIIVFEF
jgi:hypothetical protein